MTVILAMVSQASWSHDAGWHDAWMWLPLTLMTVALLTAALTCASPVTPATQRQGELPTDGAPEPSEELMDQFHDFISRVRPGDFVA